MTGRVTRVVLAWLLLFAIATPAVVRSRPADARSTKLRIVSRIATNDPVVFVTIDDGFLPEATAAWELRRLGWPITNFLVSGPVSRHGGWFAHLTPQVTWGSHTRHHRMLPGMSYERQVQEICGGVDDVAKFTGTRPVWFRPPAGEYDADSVEAAASCGISALVLWRVSVNGSHIATWGGPIRRGDIILLHYRRDLAWSLSVLKTRLDSLGLRPAPLENYLSRRSGSTQRP